MFINLISLFFFTMCTAVRYDNYTLFRGIPSDETHIFFLRGLRERSGFDVNFWTEPGSLQKPVELTIAPGNKDMFLEQAKILSLPVAVLQDNIQKLFDRETRQFYSRAGNTTFNWQFYYDLDSIYAWLKELKIKHYPQIEIHIIGKTHENRDILAALVILKGSLRRSKVFIEGGIHAREWISPAFVTYMIDSILNAPQSDNEELKKIAMTYEWYFVPVLNPDGYDYSHKMDRLWRKNRNEQGVDLNRNFGYKFGIASSSKPSDQSYCGRNAFSEKESMAMNNYLRQIGSNLEFYFSFHSYGQFMIIPYGHSDEHLDNYYEMRDMGLKAASAIQSVHNTVYTVGTAYETVEYKGGGFSICWVKHTFKVPYVLTFELRDKGYFGFALPPELIIPTCVETLAGLVSLLSPTNRSTFHVVKQKYEQSVKMYNLFQHIASGSSRVVLFKTFMIFIVLYNKLL